MSYCKWVICQYQKTQKTSTGFNHLGFYVYRFFKIWSPPSPPKIHCHHMVITLSDRFLIKISGAIRSILRDSDVLLAFCSQLDPNLWMRFSLISRSFQLTSTIFLLYPSMFKFFHQNSHSSGKIMPPFFVGKPKPMNPSPSYLP